MLKIIAALLLCLIILALFCIPFRWLKSIGLGAGFSGLILASLLVVGKVKSTYPGRPWIIWPVGLAAAIIVAITMHFLLRALNP